MANYMYDAESVEFKFPRLRRHLKSLSGGYLITQREMFGLRSGSNSTLAAVCFADEGDCENAFTKYSPKIKFILAAVFNSLFACSNAVLNITFIIAV